MKRANKDDESAEFVEERGPTKGNTSLDGGAPDTEPERRVDRTGWCRASCTHVRLALDPRWEPYEVMY